MTDVNAESFRDQLARLVQMGAGDSDTWDLSENDTAAIQAVLTSHADLLAALKETAFALAKVVLATGDLSVSHAWIIDAANHAIAKAEGR